MDRIERYFDIAIKSPEGIKKLREMILSLAMQGKLVPQDSNDPPASELLKEIEVEKKKLIKEGKIKKQEPLPPIKPEEVPYALPAGWEWVRLGTVCTLITDGTHLTPKYIERGIPFISVKNLSSGELSFEDTKFISLDEHVELSKRCKPEQNDILLTKIGTTGIAVTVNADKEFSIFVSVALLKFINQKVYPYFLENLINSPLVRKYSKDGTEGVGNKNLVLRKIRDFIIPLPPLAEQKRIVARVDALMALCDKLEAERDARNAKRVAVQKTALDRLLAVQDQAAFDSAWEFIARNFADLYSVPKNVAELKKAILQLAVMGKLAPQDPGDQPASELLKEIEAEKKKLIKARKIKKQEPLPPIKPEEVPYALPAGWEWVRLGTVIVFTNGYAFSSNTFQGTGIGIIKIGNICDGEISKNKMDFVAEHIYDSVDKKFRVGFGDLLIAMSGATTGKLGFNKYHETFLLNQRVGKIEPIIVSDNFVYLDLTTKVQKNLEISSGSAIPNLSTEQILNMTFPLPPLAEQKRIVAKVDELMALCDELEQQLKNATDKQTAILNAVVAAM